MAIEINITQKAVCKCNIEDLVKSINKLVKQKFDIVQIEIESEKVCYGVNCEKFYTYIIYGEKELKSERNRV